jgi:hypoxanthine phosphoribosyltransferase
MLMLEKLTHEQMHGYYSEILRGMQNAQYMPDVIIAPMRGGADMGVKFSHFLDVPVVSLQWQTRDGGDTDSGKLREILRKYSNVLVVDDICDSGKTLHGISTVVERHNEMEQYVDVSYAVALHKESSDFECTWCGRSIYSDKEDTWFIFPWEEWWK